MFKEVNKKEVVDFKISTMINILILKVSDRSVLLQYLKTIRKEFLTWEGK
jgi:hypothetical protein